MGDFLLDFRPREQRAKACQEAAARLKFCEDTQVRTVEAAPFTLVLSRVDDFDLWGPYSGAIGSRKVAVALAGRIALDEPQWDEARKLDGPGGLACKAIFGWYRDAGLSGLRALNGNFVVFIHDQTASRLWVVTDRCGMFLCYRWTGADEAGVLGSHPDVLAAVAGEARNWDRVSLSEFLMTGRLTFPHTYYRNIQGLEPGCIHEFATEGGRAALVGTQRYFSFDFKVDHAAPPDVLAEELAVAFRKAVRRRTLPLFGRTGVGLSGGLDSRAILASVYDRTNLRAFTLFDEENYELEIARKLAAACEIEMTPIRREPDYYADGAELGVRISGGTGSIASNHFLGVRTQLQRLGVQNILTGCYCDYMLKGLALNTCETPILRAEKLAPFRLGFYRPCYWLNAPHREAVEARQRALFPEAGQAQLSEQDWLQVERKRTFPLAYEGDLTQRVIPQRVMPWYVPIVDTDILNVYLRTPSSYKLGSALFRNMVLRLCGSSLAQVPDSNTGSAVDASPVAYAIHRYWSALQNRVAQRIRPRVRTRGSWPNWDFYLSHSAGVRSLWERNASEARDVLTELAGSDPFQRDIAEYCPRETELFQRLWTLKIWLDQRS